MSDSLYLPKNASKKETYEAILPQIESLIASETDLVANLANISAVLKEAFDFFWVGFYLKKGNQLVLGPFQGPLACSRIQFNKGVCGYCYKTAQTVIVPDVEAFPDHIACSSASKSEIVVPIFDTQNHVCMVLDVDSTQLNDFDKIDAEGLERIVKMLQKYL